METTITQYKGIEVSVEKVIATDEQINNEINYLLQQYKTLDEKEVVEDGDTTIIDFCGKKDGVAFDGGTAQGYQLVIGSHSFIPGFEEQMVGMKKGETRDLNLKFPENYGAADLAGAEVVFTVTVHNITVENVPEMNDEFVEGLNIPNVATVEQLKTVIKNGLSEEATNNAASDKIFQQLVENTTCELSDEIMEFAIENQLMYVRQNMMQQGLQLEQYLQMTGMTMDALKQQMRPQAEMQAKSQMALDYIIKAENLEVSDEEIEAGFKDIAAQYGAPEEMVRAQIKAEDMRKDLLNVKATKLVLDNAKITVK